MQGPPSRGQLRAYALGLLDERDQQAVAAYLDQHPEVVSELSAGEGDTDILAAVLRRPAADYTAEPAFWRGLAQVRGLQADTGSGDGRHWEGVPAVPPPEPTPVQPARLGPYRLVGCAARRTGGRVFRAVDTRTGLPVAVKLLHTPDDQGRIARFRREADLLARLGHPNVVAHLAAGEAAGNLFLATEWLDGCDLSAVAERQGRLSVAAACAAVRQAAAGLHHAHERGLVHRDVKPSNLFLTRDGTVKLLDLGLARCLTGDTDGGSITQGGQLLGTVDYMAPEQAMDPQAVDARADIYGLGCTLYKLLTGHAPFSGAIARYPLRVLLAHCSLPVPPVREQRPDVPEGVAAVLVRMLAKNPADRFRTATEVDAALAPFSAGSDLPAVVARITSDPDDARAEPPSLATPSPRSADRAVVQGRAGGRRWLWAGAAVLAVGAGVWSAGRLDRIATPTATGTPGAASVPVSPPAVADSGTVLAHVPGTGRWDLVPCGDFEEDAPRHLPGWPPQVPDDNRGLGVFRRSAATAYRGRASAQAVPAKDFTSAGFAHITDYLRVVPHRRYVLSAAFRTEALTSGELSLDLASVSFDVRLVAPPGVPGWHFRWCGFTPTQDRVRVRLVRDGKVRAGEPAFIDCVAVTPADEFQPPAPQTPTERLPSAGAEK